MLKRLLVVCLIAFITLAALSELILPGVLARGVEEALKVTLGPDADYSVALKSHPAARMLFGRFDEVSVVSTNVETSTLVLDQLAVVMEDCSVSIKSLLADRELKVTRSRSSKVTITVTQGNLERYLAASVPEYREPRVLITPDAVTLSGYLTVLDKDFVCDLVGKFVLENDTSIGFAVTGFTVDGVAVPPEFLDKWLELLGQPDLSLDLGAFPLPLTGTGVTHEDGRIVIEAQASG